MTSRSRRGSFGQSLKGGDSDFTQSLDGGKSAAKADQWYFEVAWEVGNQSM